ncbi:MAG TPA: hypothetical protein VGP58_01660, partial [Pyrinomonadaceae bacterium]|nr:hypothetical protein [Pyrinomonadaceae bacterium]
MDKLNILFFVSFLLFLPQLIFAQKQAVDLIVRNGTVVTMNAPKTVIENGAIAVRKSEIVAVRTVAE